ILNLARFLAVQKFEVLSWRSSHPYFLALRVENDSASSETPQELDAPSSSLQKEEMDMLTDTLPSVDAYFYGYLKGARIRKHQPIHIPGAGDFLVDSIVEFSDPCAPPLPRDLLKKDASYLTRTTKGSRQMRSLKDNQRAIYAPSCDVGNVQFDADAVYIHLPNAMVNFTKPEDLLLTEKALIVPSRTKKSTEEDTSSSVDSLEASESEKSLLSEDESSSSDEEETLATTEASPVMTEAISMVRRLQEADMQIEKTLSYQTLQLLPTSTALLEIPSANETAAMAAASSLLTEADEGLNLTALSSRSTAVSILSERDLDSPMAPSPSLISPPLISLPLISPPLTLSPLSLKARIYQRAALSARRSFPLPPTSVSALELFPEEGVVQDEDISFTTTLAASEAVHGFQDDTFDENSLSLYGQCSLSDPLLDAVDTPCISYQTLLEADLSPYGHPLELNEALQDSTFLTEMKEAFFITGGWNSASEGEESDIENDEKVDKTEKIGVSSSLSNFNKEEVEALSSAEMGVAIGRYIRIGVRGIPKDWFLQMNLSQRPVLVGGLLPGETHFGFQHLRIQKHRWAPKILKTNDPMIFSVGWRRFQSLPVFFMDERNEKRQRMLKYTPEHMHCKAAIYGPIIPPNTGILAVKSFQLVPHFRISGIGVVLESAASLKIMKKLKLVGEPKKIYKNTAFIKGMFNSDLEVSKFIGAKIQTVSGIRGQIKKAAATDGSFRCTFEDKILLSDIVLCKSWVRVELHKFYNALLDVKDWRVMRSTAEIRNLHQLPIQHKPDSEYGPKPERLPKRFNPLQIPVSLLKALPFASKPKVTLAKKKKQDDLTKDITMKMNPYEKKVAFLFQKLQTLRNSRRSQREENAKKHAVHAQKQTQAIENSRLHKQKEIRKERYIKVGKRETAMRKRLRLED
ncbi:AARP2CN (NUC121) domain-containing protein, partial [Cardiosporidium cionae]